MSPSAATRVEWSRRVAQALVETGQLAEVDANALLAESAATGTPFGSLAAAKQQTPRILKEKGFAVSGFVAAERKGFEPLMRFLPYGISSGVQLSLAAIFVVHNGIFLSYLYRR